MAARLHAVLEMAHTALNLLDCRRGGHGREHAAFRSDERRTLEECAVCRHVANEGIIGGASFNDAAEAVTQHQLN